MTDWARLEARHPVAEHLGPFPYRPFLELWWLHRGRGVLTIVESGSSAAALVTDRGTMSFAGDPDVTDYHSPLGDDPGAVIEAAVALAVPGTRLRLDSMPEPVARAVAGALGRAGVEAAISEHDATMVLDLTQDDPLAALDAKQRHEMRRKARRFEESLGRPSLRTGADGFAAFVAMHRRADGAKGGFMSATNERFFRDLLGVPGAVVDLLVTPEGDPVAAAFGFVDDEAYYLYNSSFDPDATAASPGIVLLHRLIERESVAGRIRFDLLKGTEDYKARLGARTRALFQVEGIV